MGFNAFVSNYTWVWVNGGEGGEEIRETQNNANGFVKIALKFHSAKNVTMSEAGVEGMLSDSNV